MTGAAAVTDAPRRQAGPNGAPTLSEGRHEAALACRRATLGLPVLAQRLDRAPLPSQPDHGLEIRAHDTAAARGHPAPRGATLRPGVEPSPPGCDRFRIAGPSGAIHLVPASR